MKKYIEPKIKLIELDPKQAILQVCYVGQNDNVWAESPMTFNCFRTGISSYTNLCSYTAKGTVAYTTSLLPNVSAEYGAMPS